eukprot:m.482735 g.482735  ORF g.482735 m.482735 type:complete len:192 (-) comp22649_c0_seq1:92-667(-)
MSGLALLLQSPSKDFVSQLFQTAYSCRHGSAPASIIAKAAEAMSLEQEQVAELLEDIIKLINTILFESITTKEGLLRTLPESLPQKLKSLIVGVVASNLASWRDRTLSSQLSLPQLKEFDWRIDIKTSSDLISRMSLPTCLVQMKVEDLPEKSDGIAPVQYVTFEVNKETLETMLDGLGKIRDQLSSVAAS